MTASQRAQWAAAATTALLALACGGLPGTAPGAEPPGSPTPPAAVAVPATPTLEVVSPAAFPLSTSGPWLLYRTADALFIANPDGSGRQLLREGPTLPVDLSRAASPFGGLLAVTGYDDPASASGPWLEVIRLPLGGTVFSSRLLTPSIESVVAQGTGPGSGAWEAATAVTLDGSLAWSPDGSSLSFVAALDGPSSDLYRYEVPIGRVRRLSSGPNQVASLSWSPDGQWIAHQAVESFGTGAGWKMGAVWTVSPDGRQLHKLYTPASGGEVFLGWSRGDSLISYSFSADGYRDLRAAGAEGAVENVLVPSYFSGAAYDPESGVLAYAVSETSGPQAAPGAYLWTAVPRGSRQVDARSWSSVVFGGGHFYFEGVDRILAVRPDGATASLELTGRLLPSPAGDTLAVLTEPAGTLVVVPSDLSAPSTLAADGVSDAVWLPDSSGLMAVTESGLTYYPLDGRPVLIDPQVTPATAAGLGWAHP